MYSIKNVFLLVVLVATAIAPVYAAPGDQKIVNDYMAAQGWTSVVPMDVDGSGGTDLISYNAETGHAIVSVAVGTSGDQKIVNDYMAAPGWTSVVPMDVDGSGGTDLISYNASTGRTIVSVAVGTSGDQKIVKDYMAAQGWDIIVPMNVDSSGGTDLISYNASTGRTIVSVAVGTSGDQKIVKDYMAAPGWTSVVPMSVDGIGGTDLISYNASTGRAIVSVGTGDSGDQTIVKDYMAAQGWTSIVPINADCDDYGLTDLISYNASTGRTIVSVGTGTSGDQKIVKDYMAAQGWTSVVPMDVDGSGGTNDLISYNAETGRAIVSVATGCNPAQNPPAMPPSGGSNPAQNPPAMTCSNADYDTPSSQLSQEAAETAVLCLINEQRVANGVPALTFNQQLRDAARQQANDASTIKWWAGGGTKIHTNPVTGSTPQSRIKDAGYCPGEAAPPTNENGYDAWYKGGIQYQGGTTPRAAVTWWMNSPGHRATLLNPIYTESGVAVVLGVAEKGNDADQADGGAIFVETFGGCTS